MFRIIYRITGKDVSRDAQTYWFQIVNILPSRHGGTMRNFLDKYLNCDYQVAIMCLKRKMALQIAFGYVVLYLFSIKFVAERFILGSSTGASIVTALLIGGSVVPLTFYHAYSVPLHCITFPPALPICAGEDTANFLLHLLPRHIPWPNVTVYTSTRLPPSGGGHVTYLPEYSVRNCRADPYGFTTGERYVLYNFQRYFPNWRDYVGELSLKVLLGDSTLSSASYYIGKDLNSGDFVSCSYIAAPSVVQTIFYGGLIAIALVAALNVTILFLLHALRAMKALADAGVEYYGNLMEAAEKED